MTVRLSSVLAAVEASGGTVRQLEVAGSDRAHDDPIIEDVEHDSRQVGPGMLFACIRGETTDGHRYAAEAVTGGAVALLVDHVVDIDVPQIVVDDVRRVVGPVSATVHGHPSERIDLVGVTGTNGKTTTVRLVSEILERSGRRVTEIGTLTGTLTTPEATELQRLFDDVATRGGDTVAMEVSSHALSQHRVDGSRFRVVAFTNLGRDHLDHHGTVEAYFAAKAQLFEPTLADRAVIDVGSPHGRLLAESADIPVERVDSREIELVCAKAASSRFRWRDQSVSLPLGGSFNVANAVLAAEIAVALGTDERDVAEALSNVAPVPGRFESVDEGQPFAVLVDYAHTPDGLEAVLRSAREITDGELTVVFGAGGDRDRDKRPRMGAVARDLADRVIVTSDNPRGEDPDSIIAAIISGMTTNADLVEPDRTRAIEHAVAAAQPGDVVVIAGKGHETTQTIGTEVIELDDRVVAAEALRRRMGAGS